MIIDEARIRQLSIFDMWTNYMELMDCAIVYPEPGATFLRDVARLTLDAYFEKMEGVVELANGGKTDAGSP